MQKLKTWYSNTAISLRWLTLGILADVANMLIDGWHFSPGSSGVRTFIRLVFFLLWAYYFIKETYFRATKGG